MRIALGLEYDGTLFHGWQSQGGKRTVQDAMTEAVSQVADEPVTLICAGRTDAGVHAAQQVVHFDTTASRSERAWVMGTQIHLPPDCAIHWAKPVPDHFHARFSAYARHYQYTIYNAPTRSALYRHRALWHYRPLDEQRMQQAAHFLLGEHDFSSFRGSDCQSKTPFRDVQRLTVTRRGVWVEVDIVANAFLQHMVRNIVGVLIKIGECERPVTWMQDVLAARDRRCAAMTAAPQGLCLMAVHYPPMFNIPINAPPFLE